MLLENILKISLEAVIGQLVHPLRQGPTAINYREELFPIIRPLPGHTHLDRLVCLGPIRNDFCRCRWMPSFVDVTSFHWFYFRAGRNEYWTYRFLWFERMPCAGFIP